MLMKIKHLFSTKLSAYSKRNREAGVSFVESAIIFPLVLMFIFGLIDFSIIARQYIIVTETLSSVGRKSSIWGSSCTVVNQTLMDSLTDELRTNLARQVSFIVTPGATETHPLGGGVSVTGKSLNVSISVPCQLCKIGYMFGTPTDVSITRSEFYAYENSSCT